MLIFYDFHQYLQTLLTLPAFQPGIGQINPTRDRKLDVMSAYTVSPPPGRGIELFSVNGEFHPFSDRHIYLHCLKHSCFSATEQTLWSHAKSEGNKFEYKCV